MPTATAEPIIEIRGLHKRFGNQRVHRGIDLEVRRGECLSIIGTTGSGKSTLLHEVIGLVKPDTGSIRVLGETIGALDGEAARRLRRRWGVLFQRGALFSAYDVFDNIAFPMRELRKEGWSIDEDMLRDSVAIKLHMVGLEPDAAWKHPAQLSGGMLKRAALARALMLEAELLFLDEPTTGLDPASSAEFDAMLAELHKELNLTVMMVTHDLYSMANLSDRIAVLDAGKLVAVGSLREVAGVDHPFVRDFFRARRNEIPLRDLPRPRSL
ncbi:MAG: ABC transporter, ATP-binding protein (cluster 9, phospholipid) [Rhodanobacteraceae bacterium]|jgi:phospholipid/cholesterol/gamma-HCH transport system ATP-binding protein|nr:MAG: ABC transporter, ATP-binding protein (cluster 9, phospholipid) [Rhodanobacteraceae bacterium]